ncbi:MAG: hypothetical protein ACYCW6_04980 [Candidatus Xenobia bacterium]
MKSCIWLTVLLLVVLLHPAATVAAPSPTPQPLITTAPKARGDMLVVPGVRVGPAHLGEPLPTLLKQAGHGLQLAQGPYKNVIYEGFVVTVPSRGKQTVMAVVVNDPAYKLKNGIGIGSTQEQVEKVLGKPSVVKSMGKETMGMIDHSVTYPKLGLSINYNKAHKVVQMAISSPHPK